MDISGIAGIVNLFTDDDSIYMLLEDSSSSSSSEDEVAAVLSNISGKKKRVTITNYIYSVVPNYSDEVFRQHFRLKKELFNSLTVRFGNSEKFQKLLKNANTRCNITPEKHLLTFLWFAGHHSASFRDVADRFDLSLSSLYDVTKRVVDFLLSDLLDEVIRLPNNAEKVVTKNYYAMYKQFPRVVGSIDGSHIKIDRPTERHVDYFNRKDYYSIILQGVCNEKSQFIDIFVGYPGSVHDARVFRNSPFHNSISSLCEDGEYVLGDSAYPLNKYLLTPYRDNGHLTHIQKNFNIRLSSCRVSIEHAFGLLKQRFRQLYHLKLKGQDRICQFITACCVLHNLCVDDKKPFEDDDKCVDDQPDTIPYHKLSSKNANAIRDQICKELPKLNKIRV